MLSDDSLENIKIRNDYAQYLRIMLRAGILHGIFSNSPPTTLMPFPEAMVRLHLIENPSYTYSIIITIKMRGLIKCLILNKENRLAKTKILKLNNFDNIVQFQIFLI